MSADTFTKAHVFSRLQDSLDRLHRETEKVEIWATALSAFVQPIPEYELRADFLLPPREQPH